MPQATITRVGSNEYDWSLLVHRPTSILSQTRGLIGKPPLTHDGGLWLPNCHSVHTWFMQYPIDVVFLRNADDDWIVERVFDRLRPWCAYAGSRRATAALELAAGAAQRLKIAVGDRLRLTNALPVVH